MPKRNNHSRKDFIKKTALALGFASVATVGAFASQKEERIAKLPADQQQFIRLYKQWLNRFKTCAEIQKTEPNNVVNNKTLMKLADESRMWNGQLRHYMADPIFSAYFAKFTAKTTEQIS